MRQSFQLLVGAICARQITFQAQNSARISLDCKTVRIFAYSSTHVQSNETENRERDLGRYAKNTDCLFCKRYFRSNFLLLSATANSYWLNFDASCQVMFSTSHSRCSLPWWIAKAFAVKWQMLIAWICSQELGFVLKSEQSEALELLLRRKDVFCVLPTGFDKSLIYQMFVHAKSSSSSVQRPTVIVILPG